MRGNCRFEESQKNINHLIYIYHSQFFVKNEKDMDTLIQTIRFYSQDIEMEFGIEKSAMLITKSGVRETRE